MELAAEAVEAHELVLVELTRRPEVCLSVNVPGVRKLRPPGVGMLDTLLLGEVDLEVLDSRLVFLLGTLVAPEKTKGGYWLKDHLNVTPRKLRKEGRMIASFPPEASTACTCLS